MFQIDHTDGLARAGLLNTATGSVKTPFFMPVERERVHPVIKSFSN